MENLNLPKADLRIDGGEVCCLIRKKWIVLQPEEWVRQHFISLLINHLGYPKGLISLEYSLKYFKNRKRSDIAVTDRGGNIFMLVECKSADVKLDEQVVKQVSEYSKILSAKYVVITNGLQHFVWEKAGSQYTQIKNFPDFQHESIDP